ncbi:hypothetical protein HYDPIDRAFT_100253 [Hydnomerulius pinastri MD-312]|uniref:Uncharacterized protein n=1 Tax=Hydnomerulius pinastri MD-312 TaxID=994086 RepID=A0A0C9V342_9AGAM|nr:hypothetical protein HYDPIDRAFT_100253 [Hydnomerulius pinastri MD-312]
MSGARGCFNCGGCAWCFRVVRFAFPSISFVIRTKDLPTIAMAITHLFYLHLLIFCVLCGADVDRCVLFAFHIFTDDICYRRTTRKNRNKSYCSCFLTRYVRS